MKKIIATLMVVALSTVSAKAVDLSVFELTAGLSANQSVFGAVVAYKHNEGVVCYPLFL